MHQNQLNQHLYVLDIWWVINASFFSTQYQSFNCMSTWHQIWLNLLNISVYQTCTQPRVLTRTRRMCVHSSMNAIEWQMSPDCKHRSNESWHDSSHESWHDSWHSLIVIWRNCPLTHGSMHESWHDSSHESWHDSSYSLFHLSLSFFFITFDSSILCLLNIIASSSTNSIFLVICIISLNPKKEMSGMSKRQCCSICGSSKQYNQYLPKLKVVDCI